MADKCYKPGDFDRLLDLADGHADLGHMETCLDCRTQLDLYRSFLDRELVPEGADLADANARLGAFLEREIGPAIEAGPSPKSAPRRWDVRRWSPVLVAACLVCVAIFVRYGDEGNMTDPSGVVRDLSTSTSALETSLTFSNDRFVLAWAGTAEATNYQVVFQDAALTELHRIDAGPDLQIHLDRADFPWLQGSGPVFWYVTAQRDGDNIARSSLRALEAGS